MKFALMGLFAVAFVAFSVNRVNAQHYHNFGGQLYYHQNVPHYHDRAGHLVDRYGHHIDGHGNHTRIGVYENGSISPYSYSQNYYSYRPYVPSATYPLGAPNNTAPLVERVVIGANRNNIASSSAARWPSRGKVTIVNPRDSGGDVRYSLNGTEYRIQPGYTQVFDDDRNWIVAFGSGGSKGELRYTLIAGTYKFTPHDTGWDLKLAKEIPSASPQGEIPPPLPSPE